MTESAAPERILVGHIRGAFGIQGWVDVWPYSNEPVGLLKSKLWWHEQTGEAAFEVQECKQHIDRIVAKLAGIDDRTAAEAAKGHQLWIDKTALPKIGKDEFYFVDLVGCTVELASGGVLGKVSSVDDNGAHAILNIQTMDEQAPRKYAIPFVNAYVSTVDISLKRIVVDWQTDWQA